MKNLILILCLTFGFMSQSNAQVFPVAVGDTLTNADSTSYIIDLRNSNAVSLLTHLQLTRISGTGTITVRVYTTNFNRTSWVHTSTTSVGTTATSALVNYLNSANPGRYVRINVVQSGTASTRPTLAYCTRLQ